ncbi:MAG: translation elongation factor Ts [Phycisphaerae bacterium]
MAVTAAMVSQLRTQTGLPMMDCKKALEESGGDIEAAKEVLRKAGHGRMAKFAGREAAKGRVAVHIGNGVASIVEMRCETEPVAGTEDFVALANAAAQVAAGMDNPTPATVLAAARPGGSGTIQEFLNEVFNKIREKMELKRVARLTGVCGSYIHFNSQNGAIVSLSGACPDEVMRDVCMHIVSIKPAYSRRDQVPAADVERERAAFMEEAKGKPPQIAEKMVAGKLDRWFGESVLPEQPFVKDDKQSVAAYIGKSAAGVTITDFVRFEVGAM